MVSEYLRNTILSVATKEEKKNGFGFVVQECSDALDVLGRTKVVKLKGFFGYRAVKRNERAN